MRRCRSVRSTANNRSSVPHADFDGSGNMPKRSHKLKLGTSTPESFVFSPDGGALFGSAYYTGVSNIYRFDIATQKYEAVSNSSTGLFRPMPQADGSMLAYEFAGEGFQPVRFDPKPVEDLGAIKFLGAEIAAKHPIVKSWGVGSPSKVPLDSLITERGKYVPMNAPIGRGLSGDRGYKARSRRLARHFRRPPAVNQAMRRSATREQGHPKSERCCRAGI